MPFRFNRISVIGDGGWGTTLAILLSAKGLDVALWSHDPSYAAILDKKRVNPDFLKGINIPKSIRISSDIEEVLDCDLIVVAVPAQYLRQALLGGARVYRRRLPVVSVVKGIEENSGLRMSEVIKDVWPAEDVAVLSGPTIALETARGLPTTAVIAYSGKGLLARLQDLFTTGTFRIYTSADVTGVELGGSLKNIIAIACGISDGLGLGTNTKAAIVSRGLAEMTKLGTAMGAKKETFFGLSGLGDLVTTCFNPLSRNHYVGEQIGRGQALDEITSKMKMVAEGVATTKSAFALSKKLRVDMPIVNEIFHVLFKNRPAKKAVENLMLRKKKAE